MEKTDIKKYFIRPDASIKEAMLQLNENGIKILFILDKDEKLAGTLTDGDIRRGITEGVCLTTNISDIMTTNYISINVDDTDVENKVKNLMQRYFIEHVPIIDAERRLIDIISWRDFVISETDKRKEALSEFPVVIMAGGKGTRLDPFTKILPKPLIPLGDKPIVEVIMDRFYERGFYKFYLVINHKKEIIKLYFTENKLPYEITLVEEREYCGTVGGLSLLKDKINSTFILTNCDTLLEGEYSDFLNWHIENKNLLTIIGSHKEVAVPYGVLNMNNGSLIKMIEKPQYDLFVNTGTYVMDPEIFNYIYYCSHMDIDQLIIKIQDISKNRIGVFPCWGRWFDIGQLDEYKKTLYKMGIEN